MRRSGVANTVIVYPNEHPLDCRVGTSQPAWFGSRTQKDCPLTQNQRIRPYFSFTFCRSRSPESFGPVLAPKLAPRPPTKPDADKHTHKQANKQTNRRGAKEQPLHGHVAVHPAPTSTQVKEIDIPLGGQTAFPPRSDIQINIEINRTRRDFSPRLLPTSGVEGAMIYMYTRQLKPA